MKVFNLYLKLVKKNSGIIILYIVIFLVLAFMFGSTDSNVSTTFEETKVKVTMINEDDEDSVLVQNLHDYLEKYVEYVDVDKKDIPDALYFRQIYHVFTIPQGFTEAFMKGEEVLILHENTPDSIVNFAVETALNNYLKLVRVYLEQSPDMDITEILPLVKSNLEKNAEVSTKVIQSDKKQAAGFYYNYLSYILFAVVLSVVGMIMIKLKQFNIKQRMLVSPYKQTKMNLELFLGNAIFTVVFLILVIILSFFMFSETMFTTCGLLLIINTLCLSIAILSCAYLITMFIKNEEILSAVTNVFALGTAFICGAFVPQALLGKGLLTMAHIFPNYYFINNNDRIIEIQTFNWENLKQIILYMGVQLLYAIVFIALAIFVSRKQMKQEQ